MGQRVVIQWAVSGFFGWGVYGLNLALQWSADPALEPVGAVPIPEESLGTDPLRRLALAPFLARSAEFQAGLKQFANGRTNPGVPVLVGLGNQFVAGTAAHNVTLEGKPAIGVIFFEEELSPTAVDLARRYALIVTGSSWNEGLLRAAGVEHVRTVLQGVDPALFHSGPKLDVLKDRFLIFSGGKAELRKGQDIVLAAFKIFSERHPEALLVTAWHSLQPMWAQSLSRSRVAPPAAFDRDGRLDVAAWAAASGVRRERVLDLGNVPNFFLAQVLRAMDVAVFPNRAEGGTNLVAMECMACGLPVVLSQNSGHLDLIRDGNCYPLADQRPAAGEDPAWRESQVEEVVERLEEVFSGRAEAKRRGARAAEILSRMSWAETARRMKEIVRELA